MTDESKIAEGATRALLSVIPEFFSWLKNIGKRKKKKTEQDIKRMTNILFIDDNKFEYIDVIRGAGWNVHQIFDLSSFDDEQVKMADIIFLDYMGVGKSLAPAQEGIGLLKGLKRKYPDKPVIFYSAHAGFSLGDEFKAADDWLPKNADTFIYLEKIEEFAKRIHSK
jgi:hypothetical protein